MALAHHDVVLVLLFSPSVREYIVRDKLPHGWPLAPLERHLQALGTSKVAFGIPVLILNPRTHREAV
jgi:hypothetical protein